MDEYIRYYIEHFKSAKMNKWNYEDGCVLIGLIDIYDVTKEEYIKVFILDYLEKYINDAGEIQYYDKEVFHLDSICPGRALFFAFEETGNEKYKKAIHQLYQQILHQPRTNCGSFWHKTIYPNQIWLDGLYMAMPFYMKYDTELGKMEHYQDIIHQFENVREFLFCEEKGLYYHGYDETGTMPWADKKNHCSKNFWLRSIGWFLMALTDTMEAMSEMLYEHYRTLEIIFKEALKGILQYQDPKSKLFYQILEHPNADGNYLETSGSAMVSAAILKACRMGILLSEKYQHVGSEILEAIRKDKLVIENGNPTLKDICYSAGLGPGTDRDGSVEYYLSEPFVNDDGKGAGALMMAYGQWLKLNKKNGIKVRK